MTTAYHDFTFNSNTVLLVKNETGFSNVNLLQLPTNLGSIPKAHKLNAYRSCDIWKELWALETYW